MFNPTTAVDVADVISQDGDVRDIVNTPAGPTVFITRGVHQFAIMPHSDVDGAVTIIAHQHTSADDAALCHAAGVTAMVESVAEFEAMAAQGHLVARSQQTPPTGMYV